MHRAWFGKEPREEAYESPEDQQSNPLRFIESTLQNHKPTASCHPDKCGGVWVISGLFKTPPGSKHSGNLPNSRTVVLKSDLLHSSKPSASLDVFTRRFRSEKRLKERERDWQRGKCTEQLYSILVESHVSYSITARRRAWPGSRHGISILIIHAFLFCFYIFFIEFVNSFRHFWLLLTICAVFSAKICILFTNQSPVKLGPAIYYLTLLYFIIYLYLFVHYFLEFVSSFRHESVWGSFINRFIYLKRKHASNSLTAHSWTWPGSIDADLACKIIHLFNLN